MIYTSHYNNPQFDALMEEGRYIVAISRSYPDWLIPDSHFIDFAPSKELFSDFKKGKITWEQYKKTYLKELEEKKPMVANAAQYFAAKEAILCCWENNPEDCHRSLLAKYIQDNFGIQVKEI